jgi:tRNA (guanine-N7-)-methyltransferase
MPVALEILPGQVTGPFDFQGVFGNPNPVEVEIGSGKGRFLLEQAALRQEVNFLGLEWSLKYLRVARERAERRHLANVRFFRADARHVVTDLIPDGSVARVHVYCPDPWPKKRHRKRRLFSPDVCTHLGRILLPAGYLHVSTDIREYFDEIRATLAAHSNLVEREDPLFPAAAPEGRTSYEVKYMNERRPIYRASFSFPGLSRSPR